MERSDRKYLPTTSSYQNIYSLVTSTSSISLPSFIQVAPEDKLPESLSLKRAPLVQNPSKAAFILKNIVTLGKGSCHWILGDVYVW